MAKPGYRGRKPKKKLDRKRKSEPTGGDNYVKVEDRNKKQKLSPSSITVTSVLTAMFC